MKRPSTKKTRDSEEAFKDAGGIIRVFRLTDADNKCLSELVSRTALPSMSAAIRYALHRTNQSIGSNAYKAVKQTALGLVAQAEAYNLSDRKTRIFRLTLEDQRMCRLIEQDADLKNATSIIRFAMYVAAALARNADFGMPKLQSHNEEITMSKTIAVANQKGGVGKTSVATTLADSICQRGHSVLLVDADDQASSQVWKENRVNQYPNLPAPDVIGMARPTIAEELPRIAAAYDITIIDVGGGSEKGAIALNAACIRTADLVIMPTQPTYYDLHGSVRTIEMIKERQMVTGGKPLARAIIVSQRPNTKLNKEAEDMLDGFEMPRFSIGIKMREDHRTMPIRGLTAIHGKKAMKDEINQITDEVLALLGMDAK